MTETTHTRLGAIVAAVRRQGLTRTISQALYRRGISAYFFWWVRERLPANGADELAALPEGFAFRLLTEEDLPQLLTFPSRGAPMEEWHLTEAFARGESCLGLVRDEEIIGFGWWSLDASHSNMYPATMAPDEAYLHNMYVLPEFRGYRLAPILRYRTYQMLAATGRTSFYSITTVSNVPSWRFKEKLGAEKVSLHWYLGIKKRWHWRMRLRRYIPPSVGEG
jgi:ribosomal protein S18 acetylase RimI-like enzyme